MYSICYTKKLKKDIERLKCSNFNISLLKEVICFLEFSK